MSAYIKHPYRWLRKQMRLIGGECISESKDGANIRLPDGVTIFVLKRIAGATAVHEVAKARQRLGYRGGIPGLQRHDAPPVDPAKVTISAHARSRFELMQAQAEIGVDEVLEALLHPSSRDSAHNGRWVFRTARIALVVAFDDDGRTELVTVLWATDDLLEAYPRPEREKAPAATGA